MKKIIFYILFISFYASAEEEAITTSANEPATIVATPTQTTITATQTTTTVATASESENVIAAVKDEAQIPLKIPSDKKEESSGPSLGKFILGISIFSLLLIGVFVFIKKYTIRNKKSDLHQIKILTQHHMGPRKSLAIIRVAGESILIGVTDHNISMIKSLSLLDEDIPQDTPQKFDQVMFQMDKKTEEEFTISGIQDHVRHKLKKMKGIS